MAMTNAQIRDNVNARILESLKSGVKPWVQPWANDPNIGRPTSLSTKKAYQGINTLLLWQPGAKGKWWGTFNQWKQCGASVKKGEKSTYIVLLKPMEKRTERDGEQEINKYTLLRMFSVFSIEQVIGEEVDKLRPDGKAHNVGKIDYSRADNLIEAIGASVKFGGNTAAYSTKSGAISMPFKSKFDSEESFYSTFFHELSHLADHSLGEKMGKRFGDDDYAFGELVAEMSACYLCEACGIASGPRWNDTVSYLDGWMKRMGEDNTWIFKAATRASQASDWLLGHSLAKAII